VLPKSQPEGHPGEIWPIGASLDRRAIIFGQEPTFRLFSAHANLEPFLGPVHRGRRFCGSD